MVASDVDVTCDAMPLYIPNQYNLAGLIREVRFVLVRRVLWRVNVNVSSDSGPGATESNHCMIHCVAIVFFIVRTSRCDVVWQLVVLFSFCYCGDSG